MNSVAGLQNTEVDRIEVIFSPLVYTKAFAIWLRSAKAPRRTKILKNFQGAAEKKAVQSELVSATSSSGKGKIEDIFMFWFGVGQND